MKEIAFAQLHLARQLQFFLDQDGLFTVTHVLLASCLHHGLHMAALEKHIYIQSIKQYTIYIQSEKQKNGWHNHISPMHLRSLPTLTLSISMPENSQVPVFFIRIEELELVRSQEKGYSIQHFQFPSGRCNLPFSFWFSFPSNPGGRHLGKLWCTADTICVFLLYSS